MKKKLAIIILSILFVIITILVKNNIFNDIDINIYNFIMELKCNFFTIFFKTISFLFSTKMIIIYCILILILLKNKKKAINISIILGIQNIVNHLVKTLIKRIRPSILPMVVEKSYSFPSGHTMTAVVLVLILNNLLKDKYTKYHLLFNICNVVMIILVGMSRIYLGVHYFSDIIGGVLLGYIIFSLYDIRSSKNDN